MLDRLNQLDRRWVFLAMLLAVGIPVLTRVTYPEIPTAMTESAFEAIDKLPSGSRILIPLDYDPSSEAELGPMATAVIRHCCIKRHKMYLLTLWPTGLPLLDRHIQTIIHGEFADLNLKVGEDYVNLGYVPGEAVAVKVIATDLQRAKVQDQQGRDLASLPIMQGVSSAQDMAQIMNVSAGFPGIKEWVIYAGTPYRIRLAGGVTGVAAPQMYPYYPNQLNGLLAAIKGAAEYETLLATTYPEEMAGKIQRGNGRTGPQLWAHRLMIALIVLGNVLQLTRRRPGGAV